MRHTSTETNWLGNQTMARKCRSISECPHQTLKTEKNATNWDWCIPQKIVMLKFFAEKLEDGLFGPEVKSVRAVGDIAAAAIKKKKNKLSMMIPVQCTMEETIAEKNQSYDYANQ